MKAKSRNRTLAFEQLEPKSSPSSLLVLLVASSDPGSANGETAEVGRFQARSADMDPSAVTNSVGAASKWHYDQDPGRLLRFVAENSSGDRGELDIYVRPTQLECDAADGMMKLDDDELRTMILLER